MQFAPYAFSRNRQKRFSLTLLAQALGIAVLVLRLFLLSLISKAAKKTKAGMSSGRATGFASKMIKQASTAPPAGTLMKREPMPPTSPAKR